MPLRQWQEIQKVLSFKPGRKTKISSVVELIKQNKLDKAEAVSRRLLSEYPDQVDGFDRLGMVYEARGERKKAAQYYRKAAEFARSNPGFEQQSIDRFLSEAKRLESAD